MTLNNEKDAGRLSDVINALRSAMRNYVACYKIWGRRWSFRKDCDFFKVRLYPAWREVIAANNALINSGIRADVKKWAESECAVFLEPHVFIVLNDARPD